MNIIELAKEAGMDVVTTNDYSTRFKPVTHLYQNMYGIEKLEAFAALVRAEREWVDLTDDEILNLVTQYGIDDPHWFVHAVIAAFKEKQK